MPSARTRRRQEELRRRRRRQRTIISAVAGIAFAAAASLWFFRDQSPGPRPLPTDVRDGSTRIAGRGELVIGSTPASYRIVYRVDDFAGGDHTTGTDDIRVARPFDSRVDRRVGEPPGDEVSSRQVNTFARLSIPGVRGTEPTSIVAPPELAGSDLRFDNALSVAVGRGDVVAREWRRVGRATCRVFRTGGPVGVGELVPYREDGREYADVCVDERGLMLEELWVNDDRAFRRKLAVDVEVNVPIPARLLRHTGTPAEPKDGGGSVRPVDPASYPPGTSFQPTWVPDGFERKGRYAVVPPQPELQSEQATEDDRRALRSSIFDVWTRRADLLLVDQGGTLGNVDILNPDPNAERVVVGGAANFGEGDLIVGFRMNELRILRDRGRWVRVRGTLPFEDLLEVARNFTPVESDTDKLVYLD